MYDKIESKLTQLKTVKMNNTVLIIDDANHSKK